MKNPWMIWIQALGLLSPVRIIASDMFDIQMIQMLYNISKGL
jgi:hypothetical protein